MHIILALYYINGSHFKVLPTSNKENESIISNEYNNDG